MRNWSLSTWLCLSVHRRRGSFAVLINFTEEGQSVCGPYTIPYLNNCLLEHVGVYGTVASCSLTQSPKRTECSLGVLAISTGSCITKKTEQRGQDKECWRINQAAGDRKL